MKLTEKYLLQVFATFSNSAYGKKLSKQHRYGVYKPEIITFEEWVEYLGPNGNNLEHMLNTYQQTKEVMEWSDLSTEQKSKLYLTALIHDWGEAIVGDINYVLKTHDDELDEIEAFKKIIAEIIKDESERELLLDVYLEVAMDSTSELGNIFNALEKIGYLSDAMRVAGLVEAGGLAVETRLIFITMPNDILEQQTEKLIAYTGKYNFVEKYFKKNKREMKQMLKYVNESNAKYKKLWEDFL